MGVFALFPMVYWHFLSFSKIAAMGLFFAFPGLLVFLLYLVGFESCVVLE